MAYNSSKLVAIPNTTPLILVYTTTDPLDVVQGSLYFDDVTTRFGSVIDATILVQSPFYDVNVPVPPVALRFVQSAGGAATFKLHPSSPPVVYYNLGTRGTGTEILTRVNGNYQYYSSTGSHALAPQSGQGEILVEITLSATSTITTSGYTKTTGSFTTTSGHKFLCRSNKTVNYTSLEIIPLQ